jgi:transcriptional regulator with XRE-family HTH domain
MFIHTWEVAVRIDNPADIGALVREARAEAGLTQTQLARHMGASREWVINLEQGRPGLSLDLVLRALAETGLIMLVEPAPHDPVFDALHRSQGAGS